MEKYFQSLLNMRRSDTSLRQKDTVTIYWKSQTHPCYTYLLSSQIYSCICCCHSKPLHLNTPSCTQLKINNKKTLVSLLRSTRWFTSLVMSYTILLVFCPTDFEFPVLLYFPAMHIAECSLCSIRWKFSSLSRFSLPSGVGSVASVSRRTLRGQKPHRTWVIVKLTKFRWCVYLPPVWNYNISWNFQSFEVGSQSGKHDSCLARWCWWMLKAQVNSKLSELGSFSIS